MSQILQLFIWIPLIGYAVSLFVPAQRERLLALWSVTLAGLSLAGTLGFCAAWLITGAPVIDAKHLVLFHSGDIEIFIDFYYDATTAAFSITGSIVTVIVLTYSRFYMHRDAGFKRFFCTTLLFFLGYNLVVFAGNFETLFTGWELLGISSFLLIGFYRDRYLPAKNALKVISFYRVADVLLIGAMWLNHHLWHENITFASLDNTGLVVSHIHQHEGMALIIGVLLFLAAAIKSAQIPFSTWLPRAMEGPTSSSAIFYGSLSVHLGVFILLRTFPFWGEINAVRALIFVTGVATAIVATCIARVQSTVKTQIAYSSAAQIGIMFIEIALGFHILALVHFGGNAFLRTYQLLVSPSVLSYGVHDQFYHFTPRPAKERQATLFTKVTNTFYVLSLKEWNLDFYGYRYFWMPFKWIGGRCGIFTNVAFAGLACLIFLLGIIAYTVSVEIPLLGAFPYILAIAALVLTLISFSERRDARRAWLTTFASHFFIALFIGLNQQIEFSKIILYLSGGLVAGVAGVICLNRISEIDYDVQLNRFHGYAYERPGLSMAFLLCCLGMLAFPISPTFLGFDVILTHIGKDQPVLIILTGLTFVFIELSVLRIYARIFMGQPKKPDHAMAFRSS
jgi:NADH-quinone oxidoreductase subunit L